jgi:hypothetical protein
MRGLIVVIAVAGLGLWWGGQNLYTGLRERDPLEITCAAYLKDRPDNRFLELTECEPDLENMAIEEGKSKEIKAVYIPLRAKGTTVGSTQIVLKRTDDTMTVFAGALDNAAGPGEGLVKKVVAELEGPNQGLVQFGLDLSDKDMTQLKNLNLGLADDFIIMEHGKSPRLLLGALAFGAGLLALGWLLWTIYKKNFRPAVP